MGPPDSTPPAPPTAFFPSNEENAADCAPKAPPKIGTGIDLKGGRRGQREACLEEAGDLIIPLNTGGLQKSDILAELGEVVAGKKPGRGSAREITYFKSVGNAVQDVSVGQAILRRAREKDLGREVEL